MWPLRLLHEFANQAENVPSLQSRIRLVLDSFDFALHRAVVDGSYDRPRLRIYLSTSMSPAAIIQKNWDARDMFVSNIPSVDDDIGGEFLVIFTGKNDVAYFLREIEARRIAGEVRAIEIRDILDRRLAALPKPKPSFTLIQGGLDAPTAHL